MPYGKKTVPLSVGGFFSGEGRRSIKAGHGAPCGCSDATILRDPTGAVSVTPGLCGRLS